MEKGNVVWYNMNNFIEKGDEKMEEKIINAEEIEMCSDKTLNRLIDYLRTVEHFTDEQIVKLLDYISK